jgi:hypothetical protein
MKIAGILSIVVALVLLGAAFAGWKADMDEAPDRISQGFHAIGTSDFAAYMAAEDARRSSLEMEAIAGAAFLITGVALVSRRTRVAV